MPDVDEPRDLTLPRDTEAIVIPHGYRTNLPKGTRVRLLQELGGSVTVSADFGGLFRVDPENFDALGIEPTVAPQPAQAGEKPIEERVWDTLRTCFDPEIPIDIVELGLVYDCRVDAPAEDGRQTVHVKMTLTAPGCGMGDVIAEDARKKLERLPDVGQAEIEVVFDPPWNQSMMSEAARLQLGFY